MTPYDVIENNGGVAPSRREAIIDPFVGANHNDNKSANGKTFSCKQDRRRSDALSEQYLSCSIISCEKHCISTKRSISKDGRI